MCAKEAQYGHSTRANREIPSRRNFGTYGIGLKTLDMRDLNKRVCQNFHQNRSRVSIQR
jgi:hypothetical protein